MPLRKKGAESVVEEGSTATMNASSAMAPALESRSPSIKVFPMTVLSVIASTWHSTDIFDAF